MRVPRAKAASKAGSCIRHTGLAVSGLSLLKELNRKGASHFYVRQCKTIWGTAAGCSSCPQAWSASKQMQRIQSS